MTLTSVKARSRCPEMHAHDPPMHRPLSSQEDGYVLSEVVAVVVEKVVCVCGVPWPQLVHPMQLALE